MDGKAEGEKPASEPRGSNSISGAAATPPISAADTSSSSSSSATQNPEQSQAVDIKVKPPALNRRLTSHDTFAARPSLLLTGRFHYKSTSAVPTLSTASVIGSTTPTRRLSIADPAKATSSFTTTITTITTTTTTATAASAAGTTATATATAAIARPGSSGSAFPAGSRSGSMAGHDSASDLLRQAMMHSRSTDDHDDQIGSTSSTPPGAVTPRPDLTDKRLPGIVQSYFGQSTPPQTPRTRSQEAPVQAQSATTTQTKPTSKSSTIPEGATIGPVLGKLTVDISEGRGLRPSVDPYVVCEFQLAQYISEGPINSDKKQDSSTVASGKGNGVSGIAIKRAEADHGRPMAIPMRSRQSSNSGRDMSAQDVEVTNPKWEHKAVFDVVGKHAEIDVTVYDRSNQEAFLGHVRFCPSLIEYNTPSDGWYPLQARDAEEESSVTGEIHLRISFQKTDKKHYGPEDFQILKLIGKGTFGQVFQVRKKDTQRIYAMKVLSKKVIVQKKEVAHTLGERNILVRTAMTESPFIVGLKFSFQTPTNLYLVTDYMSGGELFWHLQKEGRFNEARAKFYVAELILALQHLHNHDIVYRDLKPENILLDANGHIALCDFGLSKANLVGSDTTNTFCGTTEYLAPEVLLDEQGYTKMVDFWSLGVLVFEMCCGWSPFYADDTQQMYKNIAFGKVRFPRDALSANGRNFVKGLLNRNPKHRLGANSDAEELKAHPFFEDIEWDSLAKKNVVPPFKPKLKSELDVSNFDPEFTNALNTGGSLNARAAALAAGINPASTPLSPTVQAKFEGFTFVDESNMERQFSDRALELDDMDDDEEGDDQDDKDDDGWEKVEKGNRMSGVMGASTHTESEYGVFNSRFDD